MTNEEIARQIQDDVEIYGPAWRSAFSFDVRRVMQAKGLRNIDIAERLNVSEANVSRMLRGDQNLKIETMYLLAAAVEEKLSLCLGDRYQERPGTDEIYDTEYSEVDEFIASLRALGALKMRSANSDVVEVRDEGALAFG